MFSLAGNTLVVRGRQYIKRKEKGSSWPFQKEGQERRTAEALPSTKGLFRLRTEKRNEAKEKAMHVFKTEGVFKVLNKKQKRGGDKRRERTNP